MVLLFGRLGVFCQAPGEGVVGVDGTFEEAREERLLERGERAGGAWVELLFVAGHDYEGGEGGFGTFEGGRDDLEGDQSFGLHGLGGFVD